jgi:hypothetical protein
MISSPVSRFRHPPLVTQSTAYKIVLETGAALHRSRWKGSGFMLVHSSDLARRTATLTSVAGPHCWIENQNCKIDSHGNPVVFSGFSL